MPETVYRIDRFEEDFAVCIAEDGSLLDIPREMLPPGAAESCTLLISESEDENGEEKQRITMIPSENKKPENKARAKKLFDR